ncbi:MAG TPA: hypothetical protein DCQ26_06395 [Marinilabiliales bacterium]|nr:MAG: hypothetical protein A2W84_00910 [Bacteroidetes bacterium GWC2_40_13]OFX74143.1 MAG: hypothetical protein A2W96_12620 [Bacteroidetes bacterium GWD2_40_43]OFX93024.1 MAG: hypothetical protein A2W97_05460 [Bacteroidetes bacterium GWE2_40_63]OFY21393.1 MAG: hypothetical protein A2W88_09455 [Bacteroidetes bacterium GWF2_40_13]OFZ31016.1 MAG: hypothetical protein A2437_15450 [Bacteroidetes bacterium RIFOXYC2_FULL_40_12]HAM98223.1 hypothetical protein [Marinilabiliales bacterium]
MYSRIFKFAVTLLTILTANLLTSSISDFLISHKYDMKPLRFTLVAMGIITIVFYPLFIKLEDWLNVLSKKFVKAGHSIAGKYIGLFLMFFIAMILLMYFYAKMWYHIDVFKMILQGTFFRSL